MGFIAGAILGGAGIGAIGSIIGGNKQASAAKNAAQVQQQQFQTTNRQNQPFIQSGYSAQQRLNQLLGLSVPNQGGATPLTFEEWSEQNPSAPAKGGYGGLMARMQPGQKAKYDEYVANFIPSVGADSESEGFGSLLKPFDAQMFEDYKDPGYEFRRQQGEQGVLNSAAAGSGALSGAALKDLLSFNQDLASTEYGNAFNRYQTSQGNIYQRLAGILQSGQGAAGGVAQQGTALAGQAGQALQNAGTAAGGAIVGAGNALNSGATNYWLSHIPPRVQ